MNSIFYNGFYSRSIIISLIIAIQYLQNLFVSHAQTHSAGKNEFVIGKNFTGIISYFLRTYIWGSAVVVTATSCLGIFYFADKENQTILIVVDNKYKGLVYIEFNRGVLLPVNKSPGK